MDQKVTNLFSKWTAASAAVPPTPLRTAWNHARNTDRSLVANSNVATTSRHLNRNLRGRCSKRGTWQGKFVGIIVVIP